MCKYCEVDSDLGCCENLIEVSTQFGNNKRASICTDVYIDLFNQTSLKLYSSIGDEEMAVGKLEIKYCPFCGEKLIAQEGEE